MGIELFENKKSCCGCGACANICPKGAITMKPDKWGYSYPVVDSSRCVSCGACKKVCSYQNGISLHEPIRAYAVVNKTQQQLEKSASGGVFSAVATYFLKNEGVVYGAALDFEGGHPIAHLVGIDDASQLWRLQGSKYVQSAVEQTYKQGKVIRSKRHPLAGKTVMDRSEIDEIRRNLYGRSIDDKVTEAFPMSVWIAVYRKTLIDNNQLKFKNIISEDVIFNISAYKFANKITFTGDTDYCYRNENQTSIMRSFSEEKLKKYEDYLKMLGNIAEEENNPECLMRVKRAAINCCRLYVGQIADSAGLTFKEKRKFMDMFAKSEIICSCWADYPVEKLPFQQRLFQQCMQRGHYRSALLLIAMRKTVKRIKEA